MVYNLFGTRLVTLLIPSAALCFKISSSIHPPSHSSNRLFLLIRESDLYLGLSLLIIGCHLIQRGHWNEIILLNILVYSSTEGKSDTTKHRFYKKLKYVVDQFHVSTFSYIFTNHILEKNWECTGRVRGLFIKTSVTKERNTV
jgi:hypothetical protein